MSEVRKEVLNFVKKKNSTYPCTVLKICLSVCHEFWPKLSQKNGLKFCLCLPKKSCLTKNFGHGAGWAGNSGQKSSSKMFADLADRAVFVSLYIFKLCFQTVIKLLALKYLPRLAPFAGGYEICHLLISLKTAKLSSYYLSRHSIMWEILNRIFFWEFEICLPSMNGWLILA